MKVPIKCNKFNRISISKFQKKNRKLIILLKLLFTFNEMIHLFETEDRK